jgi:transcriptional regulator with PAS, ATPase and Fis domain
MTQLSSKTSGSGGGLPRNFQVSPEKKAENVRRVTEKNKERSMRRYAQIYQRYRVEDLWRKPKSKAARELGISVATLRRVVKRISGE